MQARSGGNSGQIADAVLNYNNNLRLYRFSEVLLNAAEPWLVERTEIP